MSVLPQTAVKNEVPSVFDEKYIKIIKDLNQDNLNYQRIVERCKNYPYFSMQTLIFYAKGLDLIDLAKELKKASICLSVLNAGSSGSINLPDLLSDFGEEDFGYLIRKASMDGNDDLTRALQHTQLVTRANRVSTYRRKFAINQEEALEYLETLSIITLVNLADDLEISLGDALYKANGSYTTEYALVVAKINEYTQNKMIKESNVEYGTFFEKRILQYSTAG